ncbi:LysR family transcriptional regulator [Paraburkholderia caballeronis]|uniref:LysR family transcriptional regulator n=1 Tax=Paraburkholderia caballeronis TaxID=416943 RepID=UPI001064AA8E|nr:LysR family transcriptional regulator [Paraburkholderia caballeronis]TDV07140.1 LysR family hca operon transcriptional activator [Paraburkholderia caballeronis]TDV11284.1 LysR family hca operon transcriptional activator [Paraburkholderia caballeronis]TDV22469.1 LysR family hca operon transcriptional activator [Paraburkholderia caballeronis]
MELRHLRYFVAVAETGSLTVAAEQRLHTSQPSLSRQIRDLEDEVRAELFVRSARGVELTAAGRAFLDHARLALAQVDAATEAARRAAEPAKQVFALGFLTGEEMTWLPRVMRVLRDELPNIDVTVSSGYSPDLADALARGKLDLAFLRAEPGYDLDYRVVDHEKLMVLMPGDHRLTVNPAVNPADLERETFVMASNKARVLHDVIVRYLDRCGVRIEPAHSVDNLAMAMSLVASTGGVALMPEYANNLLPSSVVSRPLAGDADGIDLVAGYSRTNRSGVLKLFLSRAAEAMPPFSAPPM